MFPENFLSPIPRHGLPHSSFVYSAPLRAPSPLLLSLPVAPARVEGTYANSVWNASILLADKIASEEIEVRGKRVLELGCGLGLPGIVAASKGAQLVVLSDFDDARMLHDLEQGVAEALPARGDAQSRVRVVGHTWGTPIEPLLAASPAGYDLVLVSDCVWHPSLHAPLVHTLVALLAAAACPPSAVVAFSCGFHTGRHVVRDFLAQVRAAGLEPTSEDGWGEVSVEGERKAWSWEEDRPREDLKRGMTRSLLEEKQEERNRWTLVGLLRLKR
ncbi:hypothetical protein JCM5296_007394 [Sporobolomyces johnsonii]